MLKKIMVSLSLSFFFLNVAAIFDYIEQPFLFISTELGDVWCWYCGYGKRNKDRIYQSFKKEKGKCIFIFC